MLHGVVGGGRIAIGPHASKFVDRGIEVPSGLQQLFRMYNGHVRKTTRENNESVNISKGSPRSAEHGPEDP